MAIIQLTVFSLLSICLVAYCNPNSNRDLLLTRSEKLALDKIRERVINSGILTQNYMRQDVFLIRYLRARNFNVENTFQMLKEDMKWRKANKIDTILEEDWTDMREKYPCYMDTFSRDGSPVLTGSVGDWDLRQLAVAGRIQEAVRYEALAIEEAARLVRQLQSLGSNITRANFLINMDNFNIIQQGCVQCVPAFTGLVNIYEQHYPNYLNNIIIVNTPPSFQVILRLMRQLMSPMTRDALKVYGHDKSQWKKKLHEFVDESQLRPEFGGTFNGTGSAINVNGNFLVT